MRQLILQDRHVTYRLWHGELNPGRSSLLDEFCVDRPKSIAVPETIDAVRQQDRHVTYREIETTLGISGTSIYSILNEHLTVKKNLFALDPTQIVNRSKEKGRKKCSKNTIVTVIGDES